MILEHGILANDPARAHLTFEEEAALRPELDRYAWALAKYDARAAVYHEARAAVEALVTPENANRPWRDPWWGEFFAAQDALSAAELGLHDAYVATLVAGREWRQAAIELLKRERLIGIGMDGGL